MRHLFKITLFSIAGFGLSGASSYAGLYEYDWVGGTPGYYGTLILDSPSSTGGSINDVVSLTITTPINGTIVADLNPADGNAYLADSTFTWNSSQITEMGILGFDAAGDYVIAAQNLSGSGLNQLSGELASTAYDEVDIGGSWVAAPVPEPGTVISGVLLMVPFGVNTFRKLRQNRAQ